MRKNIRAMYFSGTGTTARITSTIAEQLWQNLDNNSFKTGVSGQADGPVCYAKVPDIDFSAPAARQEVYNFCQDDIVVFGVPVIAGRVPNVLLGFLDTLRGGGAMAVPVVLYGNRNYDDALIELRDILAEHGFYTVAAAAFIGEHSFSDVLAAGRPDDVDMEIAREFADKTAEKITRIICGDIDKEKLVTVTGCQPLRPYYKPQDRHGNHINILKVKPKMDSELCTKCGRCAEVCPMGSIKAEAPGIVEGICIKCCGCIKKCPNHALYFDDPGFLYHKEELEELYGGIRREPELFL